MNFLKAGLGRFTSRQRCLLFAFAVVGLLLRCMDLGERPLHHDESLHGTFSAQWLNDPDHSFYRYDPAYHGPFLYVVTRAIFATVGVGVTQGRLFPLLFGILFWFLPLFCLRFLTSSQRCFVFAAVAVSPLLTYYSRFLIHDTPIYVFTILAIHCFYEYYFQRRREQVGYQSYLIYAGACFGVMQSIKLTGGIELVIFISYLAWRYGIKRFVARDRDGGLDFSFGFIDAAKNLALFAGGFFVPYLVFQTSLFQNPDAAWNGLFGTVFGYWWNQHTIERVGGPGIYHTRGLFIHELPIVILAGAFVTMTFIKDRIGRWLLPLFVALFCFTAIFPWPLNGTFSPSLVGFFEKLKIKTSADLCNFIFGASILLLCTKSFFLQRRETAGFFCFWAFASFLIFSFAGEKGPWLTNYVGIPMIFFAATGFDEVKDLILRVSKDLARQSLKFQAYLGTFSLKALSAVLLILAILWQVHSSYVVNFVTAGKPCDLLSQVHNSRDVNQVVNWMNEEAVRRGNHENLSVALLGEPTWAFYFHFIVNGYKNFKLDKKNMDGKEVFVIADRKERDALAADLQSKGYQESEQTHAGWWVPEHVQATWRDFGNYAWTHCGRNPGTSSFFVFYHPR